MEQDANAVELAPLELKPKQDKFAFSTAEFAAYGGGVGNGKTLAGIIKTYNHCEEFPGAFFLIGRRHSTDLRDSTLKDFLEKMQSYGKFSPGTNTFHFPNGSQVIFRHLDDLQSLTNMNLSGFWIDQAEEVPEEAFDYLTGRCRRQRGLTGLPITKRPKYITFNPNGHDWIWRLFNEHKDADGYDLTDPEDYKLWVATTYENRDNLPEDYIKALEQKPKEWKDRFLYGSFDAKAGRIFDEFSPAVHVIPKAWEFVIPEDWERIRAIDHGQDNPTACLWVAIDYEGNLWVYREYYRPNDSVKNHVRYISDMSIGMGASGMEPEKYSYSVIDPSTNAKTFTSSSGEYRFSVADEYMEAGIPTVNGQNSVEAGIDRLKNYLQINPQRHHPLFRIKDLDSASPYMKFQDDFTPTAQVKGSPKLFIFESCKHLIEEFPEYQWQPLSYKLIGTRNNPGKPVKRKDHALDALRYGVMSRPIMPEHISQLDPRIWQDPMLLARYAQKSGRTVEDMIAERRGDGAIRHSNTGIKHQAGGISTREEL